MQGVLEGNWDEPIINAAVQNDIANAEDRSLPREPINVSLARGYSSVGGKG